MKSKATPSRVDFENDTPPPSPLKTNQDKVAVLHVDKPYISYKEVASRLSVSRSSIYVFRKRDKFPSPYLIGRARRFLVAEVEAWVSGRNQAQTHLSR